MFPYANKEKELPTAPKKGETEVFLAELEHLKELAGQTKKFIYRAGRTPDWVVGDGDDSDHEGEEGDTRPQKSEKERKPPERIHHPQARGTMKIRLEKDKSETLGRRLHRAEVVSKFDEKETPVTGIKRSRMADVDEDEVQETKREPKQTKREIISTSSSDFIPPSINESIEIPSIDTSNLLLQEDPAEEQDDDELENRRDRARERAKQQAQKEKEEKEVKKNRTRN